MPILFPIFAKILLKQLLKYIQEFSFNKDYILDNYDAFVNKKH